MASGRRAGSEGALLVALTAAVLVTAGHYFAAGPDYTYLLGGLRLADPGLLSRDWFSNLPTYTPVFAGLSALLSRILPMPLAWAVIHVGAIAIVLAVARHLLHHLGRDWPALVIFVIASLRWDSKLVGGHALWFSEVHPQALSQVALIVAIGSYLRGGLRPTAIAAGIGTLLHPPMGLAVGGLLGLGVLGERTRHGAREILRAAIAYGVIALPIVLYFAAFEAGGGPAPPGTFLEMVTMRLPHHFLPSTWPLEGWLGLGGVVGLFFLSAGEVADREVVRRARFLATGLLLLLAASFVFVEVWPVTLVAKFQFARLTVFLRFVCVLFVAAWIDQCLRSPSRARLLTGLALPCATLGPHLVALLIGASSLRASSLSARRVLGASGLLALAAVATWRPTAGLLVIFPSLTILDALLRRSPWGERRVALLAALWLAIPFALWAKELDPGFRLEWTGPHHEFARAGEWIRENTPRDALFLSPPELGGFCFFSRRATVVDFHRNPFSAGAIVEWRQRLADLIERPALECRGLAECNRVLRGFGKLSPAGYERLASRYGAEFLLVPRRDDLPFRRRHRNRSFDVYELPGANP